MTPDFTSQSRRAASGARRAAPWVGAALLALAGLLAPAVAADVPGAAATGGVPAGAAGPSINPAPSPGEPASNTEPTSGDTSELLPPAADTAPLTPPDVYEVSWYKMAGGGGTSVGDGYSVEGTISQWDVGRLQTSSNYSVCGGYWEGGALTPPPCVGDFVHDGVRNSLDLGILLSHFGQNVPANTLGDCNGDGVVNTIDLGTMLALFGQPC